MKPYTTLKEQVGIRLERISENDQDFDTGLYLS